MYNFKADKFGVIVWRPIFQPLWVWGTSKFQAVKILAFRDLFTSAQQNDAYK